jgi:hypothetical protein
MNPINSLLKVEEPFSLNMSNLAMINKSKLDLFTIRLYHGSPFMIFVRLI